ncbi:MAG: hypothetical protein ABI769_16385 [Pseudomonadota bacterium]
MSAAALTPIETAHTPWRRSVLAVFAGLAANVALSTATDLLLVAVGFFPPLSEFGNPDSFSNSLLLLALMYRTFFGALGCYLTARLAPRRPMAHSLALGSIGFVVGVIGAVVTWGTWTSWYSLAIIATTLPSAWLGARIATTKRTTK